MWLGYVNGDMAFRVPEYYEARETRFWIDEAGQKWRSLGNACWFTNLDIEKRHEEQILYKPYTSAEYPSYDNFDAIDVGRVTDIPCDWFGLMGVPDTFLYKHNPDQFEILGMCENEDLYGLKTRVYNHDECKSAYLNKFGKPGTYDLNASGVLTINGIQEKVYQRILIRRKQKEA